MILFDSQSALDQFSNTPFIIKPAIGAGGSTTDNIGYRRFNTINDCLDVVNQIPNFFQDKKYIALMFF